MVKINFSSKPLRSTIAYLHPIFAYIAFLQYHISKYPIITMAIYKGTTFAFIISLVKTTEQMQKKIFLSVLTQLS